MRDAQLAPYVGLDIGSSTVRCVIAVLDEATSTTPTVVGYGSASNQGMRKGVVAHVDEVVHAVEQAVTEAERMSGIRVQRATVNINGAHVLGLNSRGVVAISSANREITPDDRYRVDEAATIIQLPSNREIVQVFAKNYRLDGQDNIKDPVGMHGIRLEVDTHIVTAATPSLKSLDSVLERLQIMPAHHTVSSLAAAEAMLDRKQKESGTAVIDIGAGTTNMVVLEEGEVQHVAVIPVGGQHLTNDLAIGLKTDLEIAEQVKVKYGRLSAAGGAKKVEVLYNQETHSFDREIVDMVVEARMEELFELVDKELKKIQRSRKLPGGVVLTGGTAKLRGIAEFARDRLELPARLGRNQELKGLQEHLTDPASSTVMGLMLLDMLLGQGDAPQGGKHMLDAGSGFLGGLLKRFKK